MILRQEGGPRIELSVVGYQFPSGATEWHDLNWLDIVVRVETIGASWTGGPDPCLLTNEANELVAWLKAAAEGHAVMPLEFLEPELGFAIARDPDERGVPVAVTLKHAFVERQTLVSGRLTELPFVLYVSPANLRTAAAELETELLRFPARHPDPA